MAGRILITHGSQDTASQLEKVLAAAGCEIFRAENLEAASHLLHQHPDLLLLDMQLAKNAPATQLNSLATQLELAETFCLRLCSDDTEHSQLQKLTPFACGTISPPGTKEQILEQVHNLLRIKQAEAERNHAQERLLLHQMEVEEGLRSAAQIQHALLPNRVSSTAAFDFAWQFIPCETVGGDLFNVLPLSEDTLMAYMLDVSGHGVPSAMVTVSVHQSLSDRTGQLVKQPLDQKPYFRICTPAEVLTALDQEYPYERFEKFFTMTYLLLEPETGKVRYCNGGHPPPLLVRNNGKQERLEAGGTLVGMGGLVPYEEDEITLQKGDRLYLYSDGVTEHEADTGEMFGEQRLVDFFSIQQTTSLEQTASQFIHELQTFAGGKAPADDISLLCIQFNGAIDG
jgi:sigma-B regulation protein RsbU (phosphoserine phosphatase)